MESIKKSKKENKESFLLREYGKIFDWREKRYKEDAEKNPKVKKDLSTLETHNDIVFNYAVDLVERINLLPEERVATLLAVSMHDSGKLSAELLNHHKAGVDYTEEMLNSMIGEKIEGVEITEDLRKKVEDAIERHMNHPFLVKMKGENFPAPQNIVDKVVFDADMLANIGFKNVAFRITNEKFFNEDRIKAAQKGISVIQESFENVTNGVQQFEDIVFTDEAKKIASQLIKENNRIFKYLVDNKKLENALMGKEGKIVMVKNFLNDAIEQAGEELGVNKAIVNNFKM